MNRYDFTTVLDRSDGEAIKWNMMKRKKPDVRKEIVPFSIADMEFAGPPEIREGLIEYLKTAVLGYQTAGPSFFEAVKNWTKRRYGWETQSEWLYTTPGVINAFFHGVMAFAGEGEGVIVMTPVYDPFYRAVNRNGRALVRCPLKEENGRYTIDYELFETLAAEENNKVLLFSNPHNPVGRVWSREELARLGEICLRNQIFVISDEIHCDLIMPGHSFTSFATVSKELEQNIMTCIAPSKTFNLAGMQASIAIIPNEERRKAFRYQASSISQEGRINALGYKACEIAYTCCDEWLEEAISVIYENHLLVKEFMEKRFPMVRVFPMEGTYLQWLDLRAFGWSAEEQEQRMLEADLFLDEGYIFGPEGEGFERINLACPKSVLSEALERLASVLEPAKEKAQKTQPPK